jgi:hypothetical protein
MHRKNTQCQIKYGNCPPGACVSRLPMRALSRSYLQEMKILVMLQETMTGDDRLEIER